MKTKIKIKKVISFGTIFSILAFSVISCGESNSSPKISKIDFEADDIDYYLSEISSEGLLKKWISSNEKVGNLNIDFFKKEYINKIDHQKLDLSYNASGFKTYDIAYKNVKKENEIKQKIDELASNIKKELEGFLKIPNNNSFIGYIELDIRNKKIVVKIFKLKIAPHLLQMKKEFFNEKRDISKIKNESHSKTKGLGEINISGLAWKIYKENGKIPSKVRFDKLFSTDEDIKNVIKWKNSSGFSSSRWFSQKQIIHSRFEGLESFTNQNAYFIFGDLNKNLELDSHLDYDSYKRGNSQYFQWLVSKNKDSINVENFYKTKDFGRIKNNGIEDFTYKNLVFFQNEIDWKKRKNNLIIDFYHAPKRTFKNKNLLLGDIFDIVEPTSKLRKIIELDILPFSQEAKAHESIAKEKQFKNVKYIGGMNFISNSKPNEQNLQYIYEKDLDTNQAIEKILEMLITFISSDENYFYISGINPFGKVKKYISDIHIFENGFESLAKIHSKIKDYKTLREKQIEIKKYLNNDFINELKKKIISDDYLNLENFIYEMIHPIRGFTSWINAEGFNGSDINNQNQFKKIIYNIQNILSNKSIWFNGISPTVYTYNIEKLYSWRSKKPTLANWNKHFKDWNFNNFAPNNPKDNFDSDYFIGSSSKLKNFFLLCYVLTISSDLFSKYLS